MGSGEESGVHSGNVLDLLNLLTGTKQGLKVKSCF